MSALSPEFFEQCDKLWHAAVAEGMVVAPDPRSGEKLLIQPSVDARGLRLTLLSGEEAEALRQKRRRLETRRQLQVEAQVQAERAARVARAQPWPALTPTELESDSASVASTVPDPALMTVATEASSSSTAATEAPLPIAGGSQLPVDLTAGAQVCSRLSQQKTNGQHRSAPNG